MCQKNGESDMDLENDLFGAASKLSGKNCCSNCLIPVPIQKNRNSLSQAIHLFIIMEMNGSDFYSHIMSSQKM